MLQNYLLVSGLEVIFDLFVQSKTSGTPARKKSKHGKPGRPPNKLKSKVAPQTSPGKENVVSETRCSFQSENH